jgi:hypothetical protein
MNLEYFLFKSNYNKSLVWNKNGIIITSTFQAMVLNELIVILRLLYPLNLIVGTHFVDSDLTYSTLFEFV